jgi:hypothetical protein
MTPGEGIPWRQMAVQQNGGRRVSHTKTSLTPRVSEHGWARSREHMMIMKASQILVLKKP